MSNDLSNIKICHIVHRDNLVSILRNGYLYSDALMHVNGILSTGIGMSEIKERRLKELYLTSYPQLHVGECVPFYFCARSIMLYIIYKGNHEKMSFTGGQLDIVHIVFDMNRVISWAKAHGLRWAFTTSNAGSRYFDDYNDLKYFNKINWDAVCAREWIHCQEEKQAEFLVENFVSTELIEEIGVYNPRILQEVSSELNTAGITQYPPLSVKPQWYY